MSDTGVQWQQCLSSSDQKSDVLQTGTGSPGFSRFFYPLVGASCADGTSFLLEGVFITKYRAGIIVEAPLVAFSPPALDQQPSLAEGGEDFHGFLRQAAPGRKTMDHRIIND